MREVRMRLTVDLDDEQDGQTVKIDDPTVRAFIVRQLEGEAIDTPSGTVIIDAVVADPA